MQAQQILLTFFLILTGCPSQKKEKSDSFTSSKQKEVTPVEVVTLETKFSSRIVEVTTSLAGRNQVDVFGRVAGRLSFTGPNEGQAVSEGELLFKVDRTDPGENFLATPVVSPINGWIGTWRFNKGAQVGPQDPVVLVVDDTTLRANVSLPVSSWSSITKASKVEVVAENQSRKGRVIALSRSADPTTGLGTFEIEVDNSNRKWKTGQVVQVRLEINPKSRLLAPASSLVITDKGTYVYLIKDNVAYRTLVTYELVSNDLVEILRGIEDSVQISIAGHMGLADKSAVKIIEKKSKSEKTKAVEAK